MEFEVFIVFSILFSKLLVNCQTFFNDYRPIDWGQTGSISYNSICQKNDSETYEIHSQPGQFNLTFKKRQQCAPIISFKQTLLPIRADNLSNFWFNSTISYTDISQTKLKGTIQIQYQTSNKSNNSQKIQYINIKYGASSLQTLKIQNYSFDYFNNQFWITQQLKQSSKNVSLNLRLWTKKLIEMGHIQPQSLIISISQIWLVTGQGNLNHKVISSVQIKTSSLQNQVIGLQYFWLYANISVLNTTQTLDYANITVNVAKPQHPRDTLSDFRFMDSPFRLNAYHYVTVGYQNLTLRANISNSGIPFFLNQTNRSTLRANFSFLQFDSAPETKKTACIVAILRKDCGSLKFNGCSNNFSQSFPSAQVYICPYWSRSLKITGNFSRIFSVNKIIYKLYNDYSCLDKYSCWPTYTFVSPNQSLINYNINIIGFISQITQINQEVNVQTIVAVQFGFRFYTGKGIFQFQEVSLSMSDDRSFDLIQMEKDPKLIKISQSLYTTLNTAISVPNLALVLRMVSVLRIIDDLTYYKYHIAQYNKAFSQINTLCWNITNTKWIMPQLRPLYEKFNISYDQLIPIPNIYKAPLKLVEVNQNVSFLLRTQDFWISSFPMTIICFFLIKGIYHLLERFKQAEIILKPLMKFKWISFLFAALIGQNLQYFSFHCFNQFYIIQPNQNIHIFELICCYLTLFVLIFYSCSWAFVMSEILKDGRRLLFQGCSYKLRTIVHFTAISLIRFMTGIIHSQFVLQGYIQISLLLSLQMVLICLIVINRKLYRRLLLFFCHFLEFTFRIALHIIIIMEMLVAEVVPLKENGQGQFEEVTVALFQVIVSLCVADVILANLPDEWECKIYHVNTKRKRIIPRKPEAIVNNNQTYMEMKKKSNLKDIQNFQDANISTPNKMVEVKLDQKEKKKIRFRVQPQLFNKTGKNDIFSSCQKSNQEKIENIMKLGQNVM